jgi:hypothetical protein
MTNETTNPLEELREAAAALGVTITTDRDDCGECYWLEGTGWPDENFCTSHDEIRAKLDYLKAQRA